MISKDLIRAGYIQGIVKIIDSPMNDGTVCQIGEHWFYFGGQTAEEMSASEYMNAIPIDTIIDEIYDVLKEFSKNEAFKIEYEYYAAYLSEKIDNDNLILWNALKGHIGHSVKIVYYGDIINPQDVCLECTDCDEVVLDADIYTICARDDE